MRVYKSAIKALYRSKVLLIALLLLSGFAIYQTQSVYRNPIASVPLGNAMTLSIYLFIIMMLVSYEYIKKFYNSGVEETILVTNKGKKRRDVKACFCLMTAFSFFLSLIILIIVLKEYLFYKIEDPNNEYKLHIAECILLHIFIVMELAILIGIALAKLKKRILTYLIMTFIILLSCPFATNMASLVMMSCTEKGWGAGEVAFKIISNFYLFPRFDIKALPDISFGESLFADRFFIIFCWIFLFLFVINVTRKKNKIFSGFLLIISFVMLIGYHSSIDKMPYGLDSFYVGTPNWIYAQTVKNKDEKAQYKITEYDMKLSLNTNLKAEVNVHVSKSLNEYKMTLYKDYKVSDVKDQNGRRLKFKQSESYLSIKNNDNNKITNIILNYSGNGSGGYYANYQACFLPGYYLYYPRAGYVPVVDKKNGYIFYDFVNPNTNFSVKIECPQKYISNLPLKKGAFTGKCDGFTLLKGFYKKKNLGRGNTLVYSYLDEMIAHDGKKTEAECWKEAFDISKEDLKKDKISNTLIINDNALDCEQGDAFGAKQFFISSSPTFY